MPPLADETDGRGSSSSVGSLEAGGAAELSSADHDKRCRTGVVAAGEQQKEQQGGGESADDEQQGGGESADDGDDSSDITMDSFDDDEVFKKEGDNNAANALVEKFHGLYADWQRTTTATKISQRYSVALPNNSNDIMSGKF